MDSSKKRNVDVGVAYDMFRTDVRLGKAQSFNTGHVLPEFDFAAAKVEWDKLTEEEQKEAYTIWHDFLGENYAKICKDLKDKI